MERPSDWAMETDPHLPGSVTPGSAGTASGSLEVPRGEYAVWLQGSFGRGVEVEVDGQKVGTASGVDLPGLWTRVGSASLEDGVHAVALRRGRALLAPSSGYAGHIGPLAFERLGSRSVLHLPPREAKRLCGERHDWIELVRPARGDR
jgi:hypothetical protein